MELITQYLESVFMVRGGKDREMGQLRCDCGRRFPRKTRVLPTTYFVPRTFEYQTYVNESHRTHSHIYCVQPSTVLSDSPVF